jgi:hypothetical protein
MNKNRFFSLLVIVTLAALAALTISQVAAVDRLVSASSSAVNRCPAPEVNHASVHMVYVESLGRWMPYMDQGPTGVDGGLIQVLSDRRTCSQ